jgi:two-component system NarL family sensor kinase
VQSRLKELSTLNEIGDILNKTTDFNEAIGPALTKLVNLVNLTTGWVFLSTVETGSSRLHNFHLATFTGLPPALNANHQKVLCEGSCECQGMLARGELDQGVNMVTCSRLNNASGDKQGLEVHASIPLLGKAGPLGIINLTAPDKTIYDEQMLGFLTAIGRQLGTAYDRSNLQEAQTTEARYLAALEERQRLASDMHDSVAQLLFAAELAAQVAQEASKPAQRQAYLQKTTQLIQEALGELRSLVELNRPAELSYGLNAALTRLLKRSSGRLEVHLELDKFEPNELISETLYRVTQEALHNILRHAKAKRVWIHLRTSSEHLSYSIKDDGQGFDSLSTPKGLGLNSIQNRIEAIGGQFILESKPQQGTLLQAIIP